MTPLNGQRDPNLKQRTPNYPPPPPESKIELWVPVPGRHPLYRGNGRGGFGSQTAADPPPATLGEPWKADCRYCDSISQNANPASTFELSQLWHCKERLLEPRKGFWVTSGSLSPKTARVHLLGIGTQILQIGERLGGQNVSCDLRGGKTCQRVCPPKPVLEGSESGIGLVCACSL